MSNNAHGFSNEISLVNYLSDKKIKDLNKNMKSFITWLFNITNEDTFVYAGLTQKPTGERKNPKPDIWIKVNGVTKNISIKEGAGNSVHQEPFLEFCDFLKSLNIPINIINNLKLYHFGDDTLEGNGPIRFSTNQIKEKYKQKIFQTNKYLNNSNILEKILNRVIFDGTLSKPIRVDVCYHGDYLNGIWASRNEILDYLKSDKPDNMSGIMFSKLTYQPWTRDENRTAVHPERRFTMQIKWGSMYQDLQKITARRNGNDNQ